MQCIITLYEKGYNNLFMIINKISYKNKNDDN